MAFQPFFKISSNFNPNQSQHHSVTLIKAKNDLFDKGLTKSHIYTFLAAFCKFSMSHNLRNGRKLRCVNFGHTCKDK